MDHGRTTMDTLRAISIWATIEYSIAIIPLSKGGTSGNPMILKETMRYAIVLKTWTWPRWSGLLGDPVDLLLKYRDSLEDQLVFAQLPGGDLLLAHHIHPVLADRWKDHLGDPVLEWLGLRLVATHEELVQPRLGDHRHGAEVSLDSFKRGLRLVKLQQDASPC